MKEKDNNKNGKLYFTDISVVFLISSWVTKWALRPPRWLNDVMYGNPAQNFVYWNTCGFCFAILIKGLSFFILFTPWILECVANSPFLVKGDVMNTFLCDEFFSNDIIIAVRKKELNYEKTVSIHWCNGDFFYPRNLWRDVHTS